MNKLNKTLISLIITNLSRWPKINHEKTPVKIMTDPRSIWKELAEVNVRPMYMAEVAQRSSKAAGIRINQLNGFGLSDSGIASSGSSSFDFAHLRA